MRATLEEQQMSMKRAIGIGLAVVLCAGCQSQQLFVNGTSSIISHDVQSKIEALEIGKATRQDVIELLGKPISSYTDANGDPAIHYSSVATILHKRYLFSKKAILLTKARPHIYSCNITFNNDDTIKAITRKQGTSNQRMQRANR